MYKMIVTFLIVKFFSANLVYFFLLFKFRFGVRTRCPPLADNTGIDEVSNDAIQIYPNPVKDQLTINNGELKIINVEIVDITGKIISTFNSQLSTINVSSLQQGIYFVKIETDKGIVTRKIVKE